MKRLSAAAAVLAFLALACDHLDVPPPETGPSTPAPSGGATSPGVSAPSGSTCTPSCAGKCPYADDGCGGLCPNVPCAGCCDPATDLCRPGTGPDECGSGATFCSSCTDQDEVCQPATGGGGECSLLPPSLPTGPTGATGSTGGSTGATPTCQPACAGQCAGAPDGCGGTCADNDCGGCCDANHQCQESETSAACGSGGEACEACGGSHSCNPGPDGTSFSCCSLGEGCGPSCGDPNLKDSCGWVCGTNCPSGCCDGQGDCHPGTADDACGLPGDACLQCAVPDWTCIAAGTGGGTCGVACSQEGATQLISCNGSCGQQTQTCQGGQWVSTGACQDDCGSGCCGTDQNGNQACVPGDDANACGGGGGACNPCLTMVAVYAGQDDASSLAQCNQQQCCLAAGAWLGLATQTGYPCCSGSESCDATGQSCFCN
jgi:hypothetical protein